MIVDFCKMISMIWKTGQKGGYYNFIHKCKVMRIGKSNNYDIKYEMYNKLNYIEYEKDIGVIIDNKLKFTEHMAEKINKANRIMGIIDEHFKVLINICLRNCIKR